MQDEQAEEGHIIHKGTGAGPYQGELPEQVLSKQ